MTPTAEALHNLATRVLSWQRHELLAYAERVATLERDAAKFADAADEAVVALQSLGEIERKLARLGRVDKQLSHMADYYRGAAIPPVDANTECRQPRQETSEHE